MNVLILTFGTRGDVQPFVALARELRRRGHRVLLAAPARFAALAGEHDVAFATVDDGPMALMNGVGGVGDTVERGLRAKIAMSRAMPATFERVLEDAAAIATTAGPEVGADADVIVHNGQILAAPHLAEKLDIPCVLGLTVPLYVPTREFAWPGQRLPSGLPGVLNRASYLGMRAPQLTFRAVIDTWRRDRLALPDRPDRHDPLRGHTGQPSAVFNAVSRHVLRPPADWPAHVTTTGYWFLTHPGTDRDPRLGPRLGAELDADGRLPEHLEAFLAAGPAPVLIGFGSMAGSDPAATTTLVLDAVRRAGVRAILASGWSGLTSQAEHSPEQVLLVDEVPHDLLLPGVSAVVHHGGAGTTAAAAAAGCPQVIAPFVADQPFWGARMHALGVACAPLPQRHLTAAALAHAITTASTDSAVAARAADLGARVRAENGVAAAADQLESLVR